MTLGVQYRYIEQCNFFAELFSIFAYLLYMNVFSAVKRNFSGIAPKEEMKLAINDPIWRQLLENEEDFLEKEPTVMYMTRMLF